MHRRSREVATKMMYSEESWLTTRPISTAYCRHHDEVCRRHSVSKDRCSAERAKLSPDREATIDRIVTLYTLCSRSTVGRIATLPAGRCRRGYLICAGPPRSQPVKISTKCYSEGGTGWDLHHNKTGWTLVSKGAARLRDRGNGSRCAR